VTRATGQRVPGTAAEATRAAAIGAAPGTASTTGAARAESAVLGPLLLSPPTVPHRSPAPALAVSCPLTQPSWSPALWSGPPLTSAPPGEICAQVAASPILVFTTTDATGGGLAATSTHRATALGEPLLVASRASPTPCFGYVHSQQCRLFPLL
jgi:hypothetical protein